MVDFENLPEGTQVGSQVAGMKFTNAQVLQSGASLNERQFPPRSGVKVVADVGGPMQIVFASPVQGFRGSFTHPPGITVQAFGPDGTPVDTASSAAGLTTANETLSVASDAGIAKVVISVLNTGSSFTMDDATVTVPIVRILPFTLTTESLTFNYSLGGALPAAQVVHIDSDSRAVFSTSVTAPWVSAAPSSGRAPTDIRVSVNPANLAAATYSAILLVTGGGLSTPVTVTLRVLPAAQIYSSPASLSFSFRQGGTAPAAQTLFVGLRNGAGNLVYQVSPKDTWVKVNPASGTTGDLSKLISVTVDASQLAPGKYDSAVRIYTDPTANSPLEVPITLEVLPRSAARLIQDSPAGGDPVRPAVNGGEER